ncbi:hypothetical protein [Kitasatospora sp. NPDC051914]
MKFDQSARLVPDGLIRAGSEALLRFLSGIARERVTQEMSDDKHNLIADQ